MSSHIDSFASMTSWGSLDWSNPDARDARYLDALIGALMERHMAYSGSYFGPVSIAPDMRQRYSRLLAIHNATMNIYSVYLNWDNLFYSRTISKIGGGASYAYEYHACDYNFWNISSLLAACGETQLLYPQPGGVSNNAWLKQQYKLLNKLRYLPWHSASTLFAKVRFRDIMVDYVTPENSYDTTSEWRSNYAMVNQVQETHYDENGALTSARSVLSEVQYQYALAIPRVDVTIVKQRVFCQGYYWDWQFKSTLNGLSNCGFNVLDMSVDIASGEQKAWTVSLGDISSPLSNPPKEDRYDSTSNSTPTGGKYQWGINYGAPRDDFIADCHFSFKDW